MAVVKHRIKVVKKIQKELGFGWGFFFPPAAVEEGTMGTVTNNVWGNRLTMFWRWEGIKTTSGSGSHPQWEKVEAEHQENHRTPAQVSLPWVCPHSRVGGGQRPGWVLGLAWYCCSCLQWWHASCWIKNYRELLTWFLVLELQWTGLNLSI